MVAVKVRACSIAHAGEHDHDDRESFRLAVFEDQLGLTERIAPEQLPLRVRQKIERLTVRIDKMPAGLAHADRSWRCGSRKKSRDQHPSGRRESHGPNERRVFRLDADGVSGGCRRDAFTKWVVQHTGIRSKMAYLVESISRASSL